MKMAGNATLTNSDNQTYYILKVQGQPVSAKFTTPQAADMQRVNLSEAHQAIAEVVAVDENGQEILFG